MENARTAKVEVSDDLFEALAQRVADIAAARLPEHRWLVGIDGLAEYLGCPARLARELRAKGLRARKVGKRVYFKADEVDAFLEGEGVS